MKLNKGFTFIELLVVVAMIGVLAFVVLLSLIFARANARDAQRESDIKTPEHAYEVATREVNKTSTPYNSSLNPNKGRLSYAYYSTSTRGCGG